MDVPETREAAIAELGQLQAEADELQKVVNQAQGRFGEINLRAAALQMFIAVHPADELESMLTDEAR